MPSGLRIREDNVLGTILNDPLTAGGTTFSSANLSALPVISAGNHAIATLDPLRQYGAPERIIITSHSALSTTATITRGAFGTTARTHPADTVWIHAPAKDDFILIVTTSTRPADPYEGQIIYESDVNTYRFWNGSSWSLLEWSASDAWLTWTPTTEGITLGNGTLIARYQKLNRLVNFRIKFILGSTSEISGIVRFSYPVPMHSDYTEWHPLGTASAHDITTSQKSGFVTVDSATRMQIHTTDYTNSWNETTPFNWSTADELFVSGSYEAAS